MAEAMKVPVFPLNLVVFPGQSVPLHIFEERYKQMLLHCLREQKPFGIVLVRDNGRWGRGSPHSIGTLVRVAQVEEVAEGRCTVPAPHRGNCYHIVGRGEERFRTTALNRREAEFLIADAELYPDESAPAPALVMVGQRVASLFDEYYRNVIALMGGWQREATPGDRTLMFDTAALAAGGQTPAAGSAEGEGDGARMIVVPSLPDEPVALANKVAAELNVQPNIKQELLEAPSALARLQREAEILAEESPQLEERLKLQYRRRFSAFGMSN